MSAAVYARREVQFLPARLALLPPRPAPQAAARVVEFAPEARLWLPEVRPAIPEPAAPGIETVEFDCHAPAGLRAAGAILDGAAAHGGLTEPLTCGPIVAAPEPALFPAYTPEPHLKNFAREYKPGAAARVQRRLPAAVREYWKPAAAAAVAVIVLGWGVMGGLKPTLAAAKPSGTFIDALERRASKEWSDSFRTGLKLWRGSQSWAIGPDGYARPADLGIFVPSQGLSDYRLDFLAQIDARGVSWAYRAKDRGNFMAARLRVTRPGPRPVLTLVRYAVSAGVKGKAVELPLQVMVHNTPFQVTFEASGDSYRLAVEGEQIDEWTEAGPGAGGVGFFGETGERARIYWMQLSTQTDFLGRLCALLTADAPRVTAQIQPAEEHTNGNDGAHEFRDVRARKPRVPVRR